MSWFFASTTSFQNDNSETINNRPINLDIVDSYDLATHQPEGTTLVLYAISFAIDSLATTLYLCYPNEVARDDDFALLGVQAALASTNKAGWHPYSIFTNSNGESIRNNSVNLDMVSSYYKTIHTPFGTTEMLPAIALIFKNKNKPHFLCYINEVNRDSDFVVIEGTIATVGTVSYTDLGLFMAYPNTFTLATNDVDEFVTYYEETIQFPKTGTYVFTVLFNWNTAALTTFLEIAFLMENVPMGDGDGLSFKNRPNVATGVFLDTGSSVRDSGAFSHSFEIDVPNAERTFQLNYRPSVNGSKASIWNAYLKIEKIA